MSLVIGIDLGGTNIKATLIDSVSRESLACLSKPTLDSEFIASEPRFAHTVRGIVQELEASAGQGNLRVGLSAPGLANPLGHCIDWMPGRMHGLEKLDWPTFLNREVKVINDAHAALLGEVWVGAARDSKDAFMITLGTGVGGAIISGGRLLKGHIGRAGHLGHISVDANAQKDIFNTPGSLEYFMGNKTLQERGAGHYANTHELVAAVRAGDSTAAGLWSESMRYLAVGLASLINVLDPEVIILGGGIASGAEASLLQPLQDYLDDYEWRPGGRCVRLALATAGEWSGCYGAARYLFLES